MKTDEAVKHYGSVTALADALEISRFAAVTPDNVAEVMNREGVTWNYPHNGTQRETKYGLLKRGYGGRDPKRRQACGMSHYLLWKECVFLDEPIIILEHDAEFIKRFDPNILLQARGYRVIGLNDPHNATRLAGKYHQVVQSGEGPVVPCPVIDREEVPQGIAGASAYVIKPLGAQAILEKVEELGMWNNDALICRQIFPFIGATKTYYTRVQGLKSTTSG